MGDAVAFKRRDTGVYKEKLFSPVMVVQRCLTICWHKFLNYPQTISLDEVTTIAAFTLWMMRCIFLKSFQSIG